MRIVPAILFAVSLNSVSPVSRAGDGGGVLDLQGVLAFAREGFSTQVAEEEARRAEAEATLSSFPLFSPQMELEAGARQGEPSGTAEFSVGLRQEMEAPPRMIARRARMIAQAREARWRAEEEKEGWVAEALRLFIEGLAARDTLLLMEEEEKNASELFRLEQARVRNGESSLREASLTTLEWARVRAQKARAQAEFTEILLSLRSRLRLSSSPSGLGGDLGALARGEGLPHPGGGPSSSLRRWQAAGETARAWGEEARTLALPDWSLGARWEKASDGQALLGTLAFTLPPLARPREEARLARSLEEGARKEEASAQIFGEVDRLTWNEMTGSLVSAAEDFAATGLPAAEQNLSLTLIAYQAGEIPLTELLLARRMLGEARRDAVELRRDAARKVVATLARVGGAR